MRELICYLWHSKFSHYLSRPVLITELFCKYPTRPNKTLTRQALIVTKSSEFSYVLARKQHDTSFLHFLYPFYYNYNYRVCCPPYFAAVHGIHNSTNSSIFWTLFCFVLCTV